MRKDERGIGLLMTLIALLLLSALGLGLVLLTITEGMIVQNTRQARIAAYGGASVLERAMRDLEHVTDWNQILAGGATSSFVDGAFSGSRTLPAGVRLDLLELLNRANCGHGAGCSSADLDAVTEDRPWGPNNPRWRAYAWGSLASLLSVTGNRDCYVIVFVADDPSENDNDPTRDGVEPGNPGRGIILLRAEAFAQGGGRSVIEAAVARAGAPDNTSGYAGQRGQGDANPQAASGAVGTPGAALQATDVTVAAQ